jgi:GT2 family glycosyltransferase
MNNNRSDINNFPFSGYLPACSICIANYNGEDIISACIDSIKDQQFKYPVEIIVHDDASTDNSVKIISEKYPEVILIKSPDNVGFCVSNNRMAAIAKGKYILFLNNDASLFPDAISKLYHYAETKDESMILGLPQYDMETGELIDMGSLFDLFLNPVPNKDISVTDDVGMVIGACLWLPKNLWDELGGFPEWFKSLAEDMYLCCLARLMGYHVRVLPYSGFKHWVGKSIGGGKVKNERLSTSFKRRVLSERNKTFTMIVCYPAPFPHLIVFFHIILLLIEGGLLAIIKRNSEIFFLIYLAVPKAAWSRRIMLTEARKNIQARRHTGCLNFFSVFLKTPYKLKMLIRYGIPYIR